MTYHFLATTMTAEEIHPLGRKRSREEDLAGMNGFAEHRTKRQQCLPLRTHPINRQSEPPSIPASSFFSPTPQNFLPTNLTDRLPTARPQARPSLETPMPSPDMDMEMALDGASQPPMNCDEGSVPAGMAFDSFDPQQAASTMTARMPTPIQPSFAAQVRGSQWVGPGPALARSQALVNLGHSYSGLEITTHSLDHTVPRTMASGEAAWSAIENRRLPSPISECDDNCGHASSDFHHGLPNGAADHQGCVAAPADLPNIPPQLEEDSGMMDMDHDNNFVSEPGSALHLGESNSAPTTPSPGRKGHIRSRHTLDNWTVQPGMKKSFSIGYRSDCEKCRLKVPGHFNHIIVS